MCQVLSPVMEKLPCDFNSYSPIGNSYAQGGFSDFSFKYPKLVESARSSGCTLLSLSTPISSSHKSCPPTKVLPFLFLGCEEDALSAEVMRACRIKYVLNVSQSAADTPHINSGHYLRIPVRDSASENIRDWFQLAFDFIDKVKESDDHVLLHCVGGVSRSATVAIAYVMRHHCLSLDSAYRYVKEKRPTISPNLNFMGQLLLYEEQLSRDRNLACTPLKDLCISTPTTPTHSLKIADSATSSDENLSTVEGATISPNPFQFTTNVGAAHGFPCRESNDLNLALRRDMSDAVRHRTTLETSDKTEEQTYLSSASSVDVRTISLPSAVASSTSNLPIDNNKVLELFPTPPEESESRTFDEMFPTDSEMAVPTPPTCDTNSSLSMTSLPRDKIRLSFGNERTSDYCRPVTQ